MHYLIQLLLRFLLVVLLIVGTVSNAPSANAQPQDADCALHTIGYYAGLSPSEVADRTGVMEGPAHDEDTITGMLTRLHLGNGVHPHFRSRQEVYNYMLGQNGNAAYVLGWVPQNGVGHVINARRYNSNLTFMDCQNLNNNQPPDDPSYTYVLWFVRHE
ncbi:hypothetical protein [Nostoc sp.]|uniref:hypothetical protein n=1 Tax=Nostoc sp. TaxID=1180 RepID=UPI002FF9BB5D